MTTTTTTTTDEAAAAEAVERTWSMETPLLQRTACEGCSHLHRPNLRIKCGCCGTDFEITRGTGYEAVEDEEFEGDEPAAATDNEDAEEADDPS